MRLQNLICGLPCGVSGTGERLCLDDPCLCVIIFSIPLDGVGRRDAGNDAVTDGDGTF